MNNNNKINIYNLLNIVLSNELSSESPFDFLYYMDDKIMSISMGIICDIHDLIDKGYTEERIINLIENIKFKEEDNLSEEEQNFIKKDAVKTLRLIKRNINKGEDI